MTEHKRCYELDNIDFKIAILFSNKHCGKSTFFLVVVYDYFAGTFGRL